MKSIPVLFVLFSCFALYGCTHKDAVTSAPVVFDFSYSGSMKIQDTILFVSNAPATATFLWKFGDGTTSTQSTPNHVYTISISDTVSLIVNNDSAHPILKPIKLTANAGKYAGARPWTGGYFSLYGGCCVGLYPHALNDTSFSVTAVNDSTIEVWGETLPYDRYNKYPNSFSFNFGANKTYLLCKQDTIFFSQSSGGLGGGTTVSYHTH